ncbi:fetuin-B-like [Mixophyes fleayi]|uniref:fetuin-B-like n=1 Tax=Mixophyes fleayi TaxID=3061075 RepID=UPI003F4DEA66
MKASILLVVCAQMLCARAGPTRGAKEPTVTSISCNDPGVEGAADLSLRQLNAIRKWGFVYGLKRISNVQEQFDEENGSVFYITLDVVETQCHVLSRKLWKDCEAKPKHEAVAGQCKVTFQINKPKRIAHLHNYDCNLRPAARGEFGCPGCLFSKPLNDSSFHEVAMKSLQKYNKESNYDKYFVIGNITKGATQVVAGQAYHVEYTIHESSCNKSDANLSQCTPLSCEFAHTGYCKTKAVAHWSTPNEKQVLRVSCEIFEPEAAIVEEQNHKDGHAADKPESGKKHHHGSKGDREKGKKHGHRHGQGHNHKHGEKRGHQHGHDHESHEHEHEHAHLHDHEHHHSASQKGHGPSSDVPKTVGTITDSTSEVAPSVAPTTRDKGKGSKPDKKGHGKPSKSFILPFPDKASTSDQCPGLSKNFPVGEDHPTLGMPQEPTRIPK